MTRSIDTGVQNLGRDYPEWKPWLVVVEEVLAEAVDPKWEAFVPADRQALEKAPLLAEANVTLEVDLIGRWVKRLMHTAYKSGTPNMATLKPVESSDVDIAALFHASLCQNSGRLQGIARDLGVDQGAFQAVAELVAIPFLLACGHRWTSSAAVRWTEGYCPICGAWPAFAEVRGIERSRHLRCARCGGAWQFHWLHCPYCGMRDHTQLASLVPESGGATRTIQACRRCLGYVKNFTTLQGAPAAKVLLEDLASVDLDVAAVEQGYRRADGPGYSLDVTVTVAKGLRQRIFPWSQ